MSEMTVEQNVDTLEYAICITYEMVEQLGLDAGWLQNQMPRLLNAISKSGLTVEDTIEVLHSLRRE